MRRPATARTTRPPRTSITGRTIIPAHYPSPALADPAAATAAGWFYEAWPWWARAGGRLAVAAVLVYLLVAVALFVFQRRLVFPAGTSSSPLTAAEYAGGRDLRDVTAATADGLELRGWLAVAPGGPADPGERRLVVYLHGNGGDRRIRLGEADALNAAGWDVLLAEYRGYGENFGSPSEVGLHADAAAWWAALTDAGYRPDRTVIAGTSLGGGVAVRLAADLCDADAPPAGLLLRSTFDGLANAAAARFPWLPVRALLRDPFDSAALAGRVTCPVLQAHGTADTIVPLALGVRLHAAFPERSECGAAKRWLAVPGAGHNALRREGGAALADAEAAWLQACEVGS